MSCAPAKRAARRESASAIANGMTSSGAISSGIAKGASLVVMSSLSSLNHPSSSTAATMVSKAHCMSIGLPVCDAAKKCLPGPQPMGTSQIPLRQCLDRPVGIDQARKPGHRPAFGGDRECKGFIPMPIVRLCGLSMHSNPVIPVIRSLRGFIHSAFLQTNGKDLRCCEANRDVYRNCGGELQRLTALCRKNERGPGFNPGAVFASMARWINPSPMPSPASPESRVLSLVTRPPSLPW